MTQGLTLALDGSTYAGSVALIRDGVVIGERALADVAKPGRAGREELFLPMVAACLADAGVEAKNLDRVVCGGGPGSFTSLRVAASVAKGIAVGAGIPLFSVSSLLLVVASGNAGPGMWLASMPAMRGEFFTAPFEVTADGRIIATGEPAILPEGRLADEALKIGGVLASPSVSPQWGPHARGVATVLSEVIAAGPCDVDTWEPTYDRLAEAQVKWEEAHGRPLSAAG
jgi:tRNA threonylcarbamoyladenosine biosynthesis protein TsaB